MTYLSTYLPTYLPSEAKEGGRNSYLNFPQNLHFSFFWQCNKKLWALWQFCFGKLLFGKEKLSSCIWQLLLACLLAWERLLLFWERESLLRKDFVAQLLWELFKEHEELGICSCYNCFQSSSQTAPSLCSLLAEQLCSEFVVVVAVAFVVVFLSLW